MEATEVNIKKDFFADFETSEMLKKLGFDEKCLAIHIWYAGHIAPDDIVFRKDAISNSELPEDLTSPLWQQIKQWLWEKHKINVWSEFTGERTFKWMMKDNWSEVEISKQTWDSPITAEIEGIKKAVEYLYKK